MSFIPKINKTPLLSVVISVLIVAGMALSYQYVRSQQSLTSLASTNSSLDTKLATAKKQLAAAKKELEKLKAEDQFVKNKALETEIKNIQTTYDKAVKTYESLVKLKESTTKTGDLDDRFSEVLTLLSDKHYASASAQLNVLSLKIKDEQSKLAATFAIPQNVPVNNAPPGSGFRRQQVQIDIGNYLVDIFTADLNSVRVIVDTASDGECPAG